MINRVFKFSGYVALPGILSIYLACHTTQALAVCGSASCFLVTGTEEGVGPRGSLRLDLSYSSIDQSKKLSGTHDVDEVLVPKVDFEAGVLEPNHHREIRTRSTFVKLDVGYGLTDRLTLVGTIPLVNDKEHEHFDDVGTPDEHFVSTDGTDGFGDVQAGVRYVVKAGPRDLWLGGISIKLPTGDYKLRDSEGDINEPTIQPGSGSYDAIASGYYSHHVGDAEGLELFTAASCRYNSENDLDYRIGHETILNGGVSGRTGASGKLIWSLQLNGRHAGRDRFKDEDVPSTGSTYVHLTPGLRWTTEGNTSFYAFVQVPVYRDVNEAQLAPKIGFVLGVSKTF